MNTIATNLDKAMKELNILQRDIFALQHRIPEVVTNFNMYKLMDDLKNGHVLLVHPETMEPVRLNWIQQSSALTDDEGDAIQPPMFPFTTAFARQNNPIFTRAGIAKILN